MMKLKLCDALIELSSLVLILFVGCNAEVELVDLSKAKLAYNIINLKQSVDRRNRMERQFVLSEVKPYRFIDAVYGKDQDQGKLVANGILDLNIDRAYPLMDGELGIYLTTLQKVLPIAEAETDTINLVFEDDVIIPYDIERQFRFALMVVPQDWDMLYLGCNQFIKVDPKGRVASLFVPAKAAGFEEFKEMICPSSALEPIAGTPWQRINGGCTAGLWAYALRSESAQKLRNHLLPIRNPIDEKIRALVNHRKINAYCLNPELVRVADDVPSTIR